MILLVMMIANMPKAAFHDSSRMMSMGTNWIVRKPDRSVSSAMVPGMARRRKVSTEESYGFLPSISSSAQVFTYWTPCEVDTASTRNGTRIANGSRPKPNRRSRPNSHSTATMEQAIGSSASFRLPTYHHSASIVIMIAIAKKPMTSSVASVTSPTTLAKPMMCTLTLGL